MKVQTEWKVGNEYQDVDHSKRRYLCVHVLNDGRPAFVVTNGDGSQGVETRTPSGRVADGQRYIHDIEA